jgi:mannan endo-1,4-beta-mannosidase
MSWQAGMRLAGAGIAVAVLTASCSAPRNAVAQQAMVVTAGRAHAARPHTVTHAAPVRASRAHAARAAAAQAAPASPEASAAPMRRSSSHPAVANRTPWRDRPRLGVYAKGMPRSYGPARKFGTAVGKRPGILLFYSGFGEHFPVRFAESAHAHHALPLDQIEPTGVSISGIVRGRYDGYLRSYANEIRAYGHRVIVGFAHEANGTWYPWGWTHVSPRTWRRAWRHVVRIFRRQGVRNVVWLWTISRVLSLGPLHSYWPGARWVNWVGIDGYFTGPQDNFRNVFVRTMRVVRQFTHDPVLISESAIGQRAGQARHIPNLLRGVIRHHLRGLVWFDVTQRGGLTKQDWRVEGHPGAMAAFRSADRGFR